MVVIVRERIESIVSSRLSLLLSSLISRFWENSFSTHICPRTSLYSYDGALYCHLRSCILSTNALKEISSYPRVLLISEILSIYDCVLLPVSIKLTSMKSCLVVGSLSSQTMLLIIKGQYFFSAISISKEVAANLFTDIVDFKSILNLKFWGWGSN